MTSFDANKIRKDLATLRKLPKIKEVIALRKRLQKELDKLTKTKPVITQPSKKEKTIFSNKKRSGKMKRYHNYIRQIQNSYPDLTYLEIRKQLARRKRGEDVPIPDAVWENPSP
ncbi:conserved protein of unknown function [Nitrosotalea devaniterrae]|uniref:Uncharacterized protein n=1 Tax=Nitrosotalea devaniterrae TaxID=1078905 RepID=A0A128A2R3_9ARCH|nr:conserved protein of unknown function [Candidatus Nitrosotalea devanaterra]